MSVGAAILLAAGAQAPLGANVAMPVDKSGYTLFDPTPADRLRELRPDRPDVTEGPFTVDAGHVQIEAAVTQYAFDRDAATRTHTLDAAAVNVKLGLTNAVDVEVIFTPFERVVTRDSSGRQAVQGFGDETELRLKVNLWGNDPVEGGGQTAFALLPFVKLPTGKRGIGEDDDRGHVEGGLILPLSIALPAGFDLATMAEFDLSYDDERDDYAVDFVHSASLGHKLFGELEGYVEYAGTAPRAGGGGYRALVGSGLVYGLSDDWNIDAGGSVGLSGETEDVTAFVGTSVRF